MHVKQGVGVRQRGAYIKKTGRIMSLNGNIFDQGC